MMITDHIAYIEMGLGAVRMPVVESGQVSSGKFHWQISNIIICCLTFTIFFQRPHRRWSWHSCGALVRHKRQGWGDFVALNLLFVLYYTFNMYIYNLYVYHWYHHVLHKRQGWGNTCIAIFGLFAVFFFFKKIVVMYLYSIFVLCVIKGRAEMMTFALKLLHKERLNLPCFRHSTSFNRCLSF